MTILPAIRGKFGHWEYYQVTMKAADVVSKLTLPKNIPGFENQNLEDRFQRELNDTRASGVMAQYLQQNEHRFYGSIIVTVMECDDMKFDSITDNLKGLGTAYNRATTNIGFLNMSGKEMLVPIDGQHRYASLRAAITGKNMSGKDVKGLKTMPELGSDDISIVLIPHDNMHTRQIFNKINRYAKPVSKADNIFTSDDDGCAVVTRQMADYDELNLMNSRLVSTRQTFKTSDPEFMTVSTLYDSNKDILDANDLGFKATNVSDAQDIEQYRTHIYEVWKELFKGIEIWKTALNDPLDEDGGDERRGELRNVLVHMKPFGQRVLLKAYLMMLYGSNPYPDRRTGKVMKTKEVINRLNKIDWKLSNPYFQGVITKSGERIESGKDNLVLGAKLICHLCGASVNDPEFREKYKIKSGKTLPKQP